MKNILISILLVLIAFLAPPSNSQESNTIGAWQIGSYHHRFYISNTTTSSLKTKIRLIMMCNVHHSAVYGGIDWGPYNVKGRGHIKVTIIFNRYVTVNSDPVYIMAIHRSFSPFNKHQADQFRIAFLVYNTITVKTRINGKNILSGTFNLAGIVHAIAILRKNCLWKQI